MVADAKTDASGLRVPKPFADRMILRALRESGGGAFAAKEGRLREWLGIAMSSEGIALCPEAAACLDGLAQARASGAVGEGDEVVLWNTGVAQKYVEFLQTDLPRLRRADVDWAHLRDPSAG